MPLQATSGAASYDAFGGGVPVAVNYIEDVFSTYLYTGNGSTQTITNGIDLSTKGGLAWLKQRNDSVGHRLYDTVRGATKLLESNGTAAQSTSSTGLTAFTSSGFSLGNDPDSNTNNGTYVSWTFRKQPKFFDVVTYSGSSSTQNIAHNLGSVPGCIIVKRTSGVEDWFVYHTSLGNTQYIKLNTTGAVASGFAAWNNTSPTSTQFTVLGGRTEVNAAGSDYVAYLFAHNAGGFGLTGTDNVVSCGSATGDPATYQATVNLGWEPQWVLTKSTASAGNWTITDNMRGMTVLGSTDARLFPNSSSSESSTNAIGITSTGFITETYGDAFIYIAIRRGPMKVPTSGTSVFSPYLYASLTNPDLRASFPVDAFFLKRKTPSEDWYVGDRLRGDNYLATNTTAAEASTGGYFKFDYQNGAVNNFGLTTAYISHLFRRAPNFFDEVCYTGNYYVGTDFQAVAHNLAVVPELAIIKRRSTVKAWNVYYGNVSQYMELQSTAAESSAGDRFDSTSPTATTFYVGADSDTNSGGITYVMYLFATCAGVSKVGSYTGTGTTLQIDCGFTGGARFVLIKRKDSTGDWYVWDSTRGIVSGNDPYLLMNSSAAEVTNTDYIDTYSAGFEISSTAPAAINASGGSFLFLAIA